MTETPLSFDHAITLLHAQWVAPMDQPIIPGGAVAVSDGRILAVGPASDLSVQFPAARVESLGDAVLMPGLVNAHVHLELSVLTPGDKPSSFVEWIKRLVPKTPPDQQAVLNFTQRGIEIGVAQCQRFGVTTVGDISRQCAITRPMLKSTSLRVVSYGEVQAMAQRRGFLDNRIAIASDHTNQTDRLRIGISPHAPYSVEMDGFRRCLAIAQAGGLPLSTHLAETPAEAEFLAAQTGDFRDLWRYLDAWDDHVPTFTGGPIRFAREIGLLDYPTLLAHVNYCDDDELAILAAGGASVVYCPRTHAYFGHRPHRWRDMLAAGINVAVGTDSCASSPNLNLVDDLRFLHQIAPEVPAMELWKLATIRGAIALGWEDQIGTLTPGKVADVIAFPTSTDDPLQAILENDVRPIEPLL